MSTPAPNIRSYFDIDARRSSRIERALPLVILGTDKFGQSFLEETSAVSLNLHGCRYSSRHEIANPSWVILQVPKTEERAHTLVVRARVCTIHPPQTRGEFCQVGVEFEAPGNVWNIDAPPDDWKELLGEFHVTTPSAATVAPSREPAEIALPLLQAQPTSEEQRVEVTKFPAPTPDPGLV